MNRLPLRRLKPIGRKAMPHNPYQYGQGDAAYLNQIAHDIIATAHAGIDMTSLNRHQRRVEARHDRKRR